MSTEPYGAIFEKLEISNPFGVVLRHKIEELGMIRKNLAADSGITNRNYISMITSPTGTGASFSTPIGPNIVRCILEAEKKHPEYLSTSEQKNFHRREKTLMDAMMLLSIYSNAKRSDDDPHLLFRHVAAALPAHVYRNALILVGQALYGPVKKKKGHLGDRTFDLRMAARKVFSESLYDIDRHHDFPTLFDLFGKAEMDNGGQVAAVKAVSQALEGQQEETTDADRLALLS